MHTLIELRIVTFDGHALWDPARESMKVNTLKSIEQQLKTRAKYCIAVILPCIDD